MSRLSRLYHSALYAALVALAGCIEVPTLHLDQCNGRRTPDALVGTSASKPVKLGQTKVEDAIIVLAEHVSGKWESAWSWAAFSSPKEERPIDTWSVTPDGRHIDFKYELHTWTAFYFNLTALKIGEHRVLRLDVDEHGVVTAVGPRPPKPIPPALRATVTALDYAATDRIFTPQARAKLEAAGVLYTPDQRPAIDQLSRRNVPTTKAQD